MKIIQVLPLCQGFAPLPLHKLFMSLDAYIENIQFVPFMRKTLNRNFVLLKYFSSLPRARMIKLNYNYLEYRIPVNFTVSENMTALKGAKLHGRSKKS